MSRIVPKKGPANLAEPSWLGQSLRAPAPAAVPMQQSERDVLASARRIAAVDRGERVAGAEMESRCAEHTVRFVRVCKKAFGPARGRHTYMNTFIYIGTRERARVRGSYSE